MHCSRPIFSKIFIILAPMLAIILPQPCVYPIKFNTKNLKKPKQLIVKITDKAFIAAHKNIITVWVTKEEKDKLLQTISPIKNSFNKTIIGHNKPITDIAYSSDFKMLISTDTSGLIIVWIINNISLTTKLCQAQRIKTKIYPEMIAWALPTSTALAECSFDILSHTEPTRSTFIFNTHAQKFVRHQDFSLGVRSSYHKNVRYRTLFPGGAVIMQNSKKPSSQNSKETSSQFFFILTQISLIFLFVTPEAQSTKLPSFDFEETRYYQELTDKAGAIYAASWTSQNELATLSKANIKIWTLQKNVPLFTCSKTLNLSDEKNMRLIKKLLHKTHALLTTPRIWNSNKTMFITQSITKKNNARIYLPDKANIFTGQ